MLEALDQLADGIHQLGPAGQLAHRVDLELLGTQHEVGDGKCCGQWHAFRPKPR